VGRYHLMSVEKHAQQPPDRRVGRAVSSLGPSGGSGRGAGRGRSTCRARRLVVVEPRSASNADRPGTPIFRTGCDRADRDRDGPQDPRSLADSGGRHPLVSAFRPGRLRRHKLSRPVQRAVASRIAAVGIGASTRLAAKAFESPRDGAANRAAEPPRALAYGLVRP
jgi:hypothetical protein